LLNIILKRLLQYGLRMIFETYVSHGAEDRGQRTDDRGQKLRYQVSGVSGARRTAHGTKLREMGSILLVQCKRTSNYKFQITNLK